MNYEVIAVCKDQDGVIQGVECRNGSCFRRLTAANMIDKGHYFYVNDRFNNQVRIYTFVNHGNKFIKTAADNTWTNNLDNLPRSLQCNNNVWQ